MQLCDMARGPLSVLDERFFELKKKFNISSNLISTRFYSDPRDYVFATMKVLNSIDIPLDYDKKPVDLFIETTQAIIEQEQSLNIICVDADTALAKDSNRMPHLELPSWVPQFETMLTEPVYDNWTFSNSSDEHNYNAGGLLPLSPNRDRHLPT